MTRSVKRLLCLKFNQENCITNVGTRHYSTIDNLQDQIQKAINDTRNFIFEFELSPPKYRSGDVNQGSHVVNYD